MDVRCQECGTEYEFEENRVGPNGVTVKCTACGYVFKVRRPRKAPSRASTTLGRGPQGREWLVRKPEGQMIAFRELTTLQKWIVEGRISRDDEISKNGETWKRLGNILELEPFFSVYEKAQTLNSLIDTGQPMQLRGTDLLSAMSPIPGEAEPQYEIPNASQILSAESVIPMSNPRGPPPAPVMTGPSVPLAVPLNPPELPPIARAATEEEALPGPGVLQERAAAPASFPSGELEFPINEGSYNGPDPVVEFEKTQRRKRGFWMALLVLGLAAGGSVAYTLYGPKEDNPLRMFADEQGWLAALEGPDEAAPLIDQAQAALDTDTQDGLQKSIRLLQDARTKRPKDATLADDQLLGYALLASHHTRAAADLESDATRAEAKRAAWEAEVKKKPRNPPPEPGVPDPAMLRAEAGKQRVEAGAALKKAENRIGSVADSAAGKRALAFTHFAAGRTDKAKESMLEAQKKRTAAGQTDALLLYLEAELEPPDSARSLSLLGQALTVRPGLQRARVTQARRLLAAGRTTEARSALEQTLRTVSNHEEAKRLLSPLPPAPATSVADAAAPSSAPPSKAPPASPPVAVAPPAKPPPKAPPAAAPPPPAPKKDFDYWIRRGDRLRTRDRTKEALNAYGRAAELKPNSVESHVGKGWCFLDLDRPRLALTSFQRALRLNSRYAEAYYGQAESHRTLGQSAQAITAYEKYLQRAPRRSSERRAAQLQLDKLKGS